MNRTRRLAAAAALAASAGLSLTQTTVAHAAPPAWANSHAQKVCVDSHNPHEASCHAQLLVANADNKPVNPAVTASGAMSATDIRAAYNLKAARSGGKTVAIVDAYGYPNAEADLATYRSKMGLAPCTVASGCLTILDQTGGHALPAFNASWAQEQALDLDAVSAACPDCKIVLVQAKSANLADLGTGVNTAAKRPGVVAISNSYGGGDASDTSLGAYYNHPGIAVTASTGDNGYKGSSYPSSSQYVVAVGGTSLKQATGTTRGWTETAWSGAGSGCSSYNPAIAGQAYTTTQCRTRASADVSADADPNTGIQAYGPYNGGSAWLQMGGTSLASPIIASVFAQSLSTTGYPSKLYSAAKSGFNDVTSGSNGTCTNVCAAKVGWDGPTGLGSPNGVGSF